MLRAFHGGAFSLLYCSRKIFEELNDCKTILTVAREGRQRSTTIADKNNVVTLVSNVILYPLPKLSTGDTKLYKIIHFAIPKVKVNKTQRFESNSFFNIFFIPCHYLWITIHVQFYSVRKLLKLATKTIIPRLRFAHVG